MLAQLTKRCWRFRRCFVLLWLLGTTKSAFAETAIINATDAGNYSQSGFSATLHDNYFTGRSSTGNAEFRSFYVFDLSSLPVTLGKITSARIEIFNPVFGYSSDEAFNVLTLYHVAAAAEAVRGGSPAGTNGQAIFADLGAGDIYGSANVTAMSQATDIVIVFNNQGIAALEAARRNYLITFGGAVSTLNATGADGVFATSSFASAEHAAKVRLIISDGDATTLTGTLSGRVSDEAGRGVTGVSVVLRNLDTNAVMRATTRDDGSYQFTQLATNAPYTVTATAKRTRFTPETQTVSFNNDAAQADFTAVHAPRRVRRR